MAKVSGVEIGVIIILGIVVAVGVVLWIIWDKGVRDCENNESPLCLTGTCPAKTDSCVLSPFKIQNGNIVCKSSIINYTGGPPTVQIN
jgi:hypothetical protein